MSRDLELKDCIFGDGESPLKESSNLKIDRCMFQWKYPLWYCHDVDVNDSTFFEMGRAGIWYTYNLTMKDITYGAPKGFRRCNHAVLENITIPNAAETLWNCKDFEIKNLSAKGDYFGMNSEDITIDGFSLVGNYPFDGAKNLTIRNAKMVSKDAFWNCENVTVYDSVISGEYLAWNSKNITFINCTIESLQGMCYVDNLILKNCKLINTNLAFEYCNLKADIIGSIDSVKNPYSGYINADEIGEIIFDDPVIKPADTKITLRKDA